MCHVDSAETCIHKDSGAGGDDGCGWFVVGISLSVSTKLFHTNLVPETSNKTMGMKTLFPEAFAASDVSKHYIILLRFFVIHAASV